MAGVRSREKLWSAAATVCGRSNRYAFVLGRYEVVPMDLWAALSRSETSGPKLASAHKEMTNLDVSNWTDSPGFLRTGNRGYAASRLALEIDRARQDRAHVFSMLLIQFDGLTEAIDRLGHANSDGVWGRILGVLTEDMRPADLCCRLGGDEFMLVLSGRDESESRALAERIHRQWRALPSTREASLEMSIGLAAYPAQGSTVEGLFAAADQAMYSDRAWPGLHPSKESRQRISA